MIVHQAEDLKVTNLVLSVPIVRLEALNAAPKIDRALAMTANLESLLAAIMILQNLKRVLEQDLAVVAKALVASSLVAVSPVIWILKKVQQEEIV
jgi:hypothetical protein